MKHFLIILLSVLLFSCQSRPSEEVAVGEALGTTFQIKYYAEEEIPIDQGLDSIFEAINNSMSTYRPDSDISRINRGDTTVIVDSMFQEVFSMSKKVYEQSNRFFDPTVGDLVNMYGFGPEKGLASIDSASIDSLMQFVGLNKIDITKEGRIVKASPEVYLDFNAIAKGYAVDIIGEYLEQKDVQNYLIELGGELLAKGKNLSKDAYWSVGIDDPQQKEGTRSLIAVVELRDKAMATSGNYRKFRTDPETGKKYVHTINPKTGYPERSNLLSVSVLAENCTLADAYATAFMALGLERSKEALKDIEAVDVYFIYSDVKGELAKFTTQGFEDVLLEE